MYRQIELHEDDRIYQRILWRIYNKIKTLQINTVAFGLSSSPFLAIKTVQKLADDERDAYPLAATVLKKHLYVDNLLSGANNVSEARTLRDDIITVTSRGGFNMREWASNDERVLADLNSDTINPNLVLDKDNPLNTLGMMWRTHDDVLGYSVRSINLADKITKRTMYSEIAKIYDPLGILGPVILYAKRLMQILWQCKVDWDESIPSSIHKKWIDFASQLDLLNEVSIDR
ncbi:uncharacterized protein LOC143893807 [Temnothorax americanus]|uniref:uncharacterized protein LOC143893807 n=1 Tax=Temnothorax americanus TaxID=1964332 RepID=UPI0040684D75